MVQPLLVEPGGIVGNFMVGAAEGFGGRLIRTVSFFGRTRFGLFSSSSPKPTARFGLRGGRGGGTDGCGFGSGSPAFTEEIQ
jgi:hypothetical protein